MLETYVNKGGLFDHEKKALRLTPASLQEALAWGKGAVESYMDPRNGKLCFRAISGADGSITKGHFGDYLTKFSGGFYIVKKKEWETDYERAKNGTEII
jgi:hypothetical protein